MRILLTWMLVVALPAAGDDFAAGVRAYREGRFREALEAFRAAEKAMGDDAPAALLFDEALAALRAGEGGGGRAEEAARKAALRGGPAFEARLDFVRGNIAFAQCRRTAREASSPAAPPFLFDFALSHARAALDAWQAAAASRRDWPEARRNVERALLEIADLTRRRGEALEKNRHKTRGKKEIEIELRPPEPAAGRSEGEVRPEAQLSELSPEEVRGLLEKLAEKEKEKRALRRSRQRSRGAGGERDW